MGTYDDDDTPGDRTIPVDRAESFDDGMVPGMKHQKRDHLSQVHGFEIIRLAAAHKTTIR